MADIDVAAARAQRAAGTPASGAATATLDKPVEQTEPKTHLIHILKDGFTAWGRSWYRGQEVEVTEGTSEWDDTVDLKGFSWLTLTDDEQYERYGEPVFGRGPWPGRPWEAADEEAAARELKRRRSPTARAR